ncbi:unnamed protein product [Alternaria alternata]
MAGHAIAIQPKRAFPPTPLYSGFMSPCRFEGEVQNLSVRGEIPSEIDGTFYRVMPDPQLPPFIENDPVCQDFRELAEVTGKPLTPRNQWFNGDGNVSAFRIKDGSCHFKQRYVRTEKFVREREAKRALIGRYRNKFTDAVEFKVRSTANTNVFYFNGQLLACKEDSPPYALDPETLETLRLEDFDGQLPSLTFTAHPKLDGSELLGFGYEAKGDGTPDICYFSIDSTGTFTETVLFPIIPQTCDLERMKQGGEHWQWNPDIPFYLGVLPRRGASGTNVKWFRAPNAFPGHTVNAYEDDSGNIVFDLPLTDKNVFFWWPDAQGNAPNPEQIAAQLVRFTFDPRSEDLDLPQHEVISGVDCEFPRVDDRFVGKKHSHAFFDVMDPTLGTDFPNTMPKMGGGYPPYNSLGQLNYLTMAIEKYFPGPTHFVQEPVFVARKGSMTAEGDGWVIALVNNAATMASELHIVDTRNFGKAKAIVGLPIRLRAGLHGNWVDTQDLKLST